MLNILLEAISCSHSPIGAYGLAEATQCASNWVSLDPGKLFQVRFFWQISGPYSAVWANWWFAGVSEQPATSDSLKEVITLKWSYFAHQQRLTLSFLKHFFSLPGTSLCWFTFTDSFILCPCSSSSHPKPPNIGIPLNFVLGEIFQLPLRILSPPLCLHSVPWEADLCRLHHGLQGLLCVELCPLPPPIHMLMS